MPQLRDVPEIGVERYARVIQVTDLTFYRHSLVERAPGGDDAPGWRPTARLAAVAQFIERMAREGRTLVVTNKRVRCALTGENANGKLTVSGRYAGADIAHFGNIRGTNEFEDHDVVIILGREQASVRTAERLAKAIWYDTKQPIRCIPAGPKGQVQYPYGGRDYKLSAGSRQPQRVRLHPDRRDDFGFLAGPRHNAVEPIGRTSRQTGSNMAVIGYARTSTLHQDAGLDAQLRQLEALGCDKVFSEQVSSVADRARLAAALEYVREGDAF